MEGERQKECGILGPVISIYNLILSNDNDDDNNSSSSSNLQPATCNNNYSSAAAIKTFPLQSSDKLVLMAPPEPCQTPAATQSRPQSTILVSSLQSAVCNLSRLRFRLQLELGLGLRFSLWLRYCKPRTERQSPSSSSLCSRTCYSYATLLLVEGSCAWSCCCCCLEWPGAALSSSALFIDKRHAVAG